MALTSSSYPGLREYINKKSLGVYSPSTVELITTAPNNIQNGLKDFNYF